MGTLECQLANLRLGQESALAFFMDHYSHNLHFFAYKLVADKAVIPEIISDSFVKLWLRREQFEHIDSLKSFLYIVVRNSCLDQRKQARQRYDHSLNTDDLLLAAPDTDILTKIIYTELIELIGQALEKLTPQQADVFRMTILEGKTTDEVCLALHTSASTVYFARSKALTTIRRLFMKHHLSYYPMLCLLLQELDT